MRILEKEAYLLSYGRFAYNKVSEAKSRILKSGVVLWFHRLQTGESLVPPIDHLLSPPLYSFHLHLLTVAGFENDIGATVLQR